MAHGKDIKLNFYLKMTPLSERKLALHFGPVKCRAEVRKGPAKHSKNQIALSLSHATTSQFIIEMIELRQLSI